VTADPPAAQGAGARFPEWLLALCLLTAAGVFYLAPLPVALVALLAVAALAWLRIELALLLVPLFAPLFMHPRAIGSKHVAPAEVFLLVDVVIAAALVLAARVRYDWQALRRSPFLVAAAVLLAAATASTLFAADKHHALEYYRWTILEPLIFFVLMVGLTSHRRYSAYLVLAVLGAAVLSSVIGVEQWVTGVGLSVPPGTSLHRAPGPYGSPDNLGLLFDRAIPIWFAAALLLRIPAWRRGLWIIPGALFSLTLLLTFSRGAWLAVVLGCLLVLVLAFRWGRWLLLAVALLGLLGMAAGGASLLGAVNSGHSGTVHQRIDIWTSSLHMIRDHPLLGVGPDNFLHYYAPTRRQDRWQHQCPAGAGYMLATAGFEPCQSHPHDEVLDAWLSTGIAGLAAFVWIQVLFWRESLRSWFRERDPLVIGVMGAMFAALAHGLVDNSYFLPDLALYFWVLCGFVSLAPQRVPGDTGSAAPEPLPVAAQG
jgi:O-antigen ligase